MRSKRRRSIEELAPYLLNFPNPPEPVAWSAIFGNDHPIEVEVGHGKGLFLLNTSEAHPEVNYLGIEIARKFTFYVATRMAVRERNNVRLACGDGRLFLADCTTPGSVRTVHVYFPDPWWKKRHVKRRLFTAEFAQACQQALAVGGKLQLVTDVADYFAMACALVAESTALRELPPPEENAPQHDLDYLTNFERKFRKEGRPIHRATFEKVGN